MTSRRESRSSSLSGVRVRLGWIAASTPSSLRRRRQVSRFVLAEDEVQLVQDARAGQFFHEVQGQGVLDELFACVLMWKPYRCSKRTARMMRVGSSTKLRAWMMRIVLRWMSLWPPKKSTRQPNCPLVEAEGHRIDGEVAAEEIHLDGREFHSGAGRRGYL